MNNVEIMGGLGNQLFQYAFSRYLQKLGVKNVVLRKDFFTIQFPENNGITKREFVLDKYNTQYVVAAGEKTYRDYCDENDYRDDYAVGSDEVLYEGYWQNIDFYNAVKKEIQEELKLKPEFIDDSMAAVEKDMSSCNSVALHIRRSDYLTQVNAQIFEQLTQDYYASAVSIIEQYTHEKPVLYIFSDDPKYAAENMKDFMGCRTVIMPSGEPYQDMYLMTKAKHNIIANSTFSWWGATLNANPDNITVAPSRWMKGRTVNLYHKDWITL